MDKERLILELGKLLSVLLAALCGFFIGLERRLRSKEAGIRTHTLVCMGAALLMVVSKFGFEGDRGDPARIAAQVVSGIGFLGAGIIMFRGQRLHGLTTAAGVWATAAIGLAIGAELWIVGIVATLLMIGVQLLMHSNLKPFRIKKTFVVKIKFRNEVGAAPKLKKIFAVDHFKDLVMERRGAEIFYSATLHTVMEFSSLELDEIMSQNPFIDAIERCDFE